MPQFTNDGHAIHYELHGTGMPVLMLHGICVSFAGNFGAWGWIERLTGAGLQVIGMDFRGHGKSAKSHDPGDYGFNNLASDVLALLDHLNLQQVSLIGYSMGSAVALHLLQKFPGRFKQSVLIGTGDGLIGIAPYTMSEVSIALRQALERPAFPADLPGHIAAYWNFATKLGGDRLASLAAASASMPASTSLKAGMVSVPVLVVSGELDPVLGQGRELAKSLPMGKYLEIAGADHFALAAHVQAQIAVADFLAS
jgi:pimeloyl-ACP methyl ester carboxylesterase